MHIVKAKNANGQDSWRVYTDQHKYRGEVRRGKKSRYVTDRGGRGYFLRTTARTLLITGDS